MSNNYSGFDLTMYNLFTLLRQVYYTRGETEETFLAKNGGTIGGNLTIQGNLTINGQTYSIDTQNLKVQDYTITLAKGNTTAIASMVGMIVPKYDGTNYGFFGWDADGYAYVGDLDNYDGTSNITLANNPHLQKLATIDVSTNGVSSNSVMLYDMTNHKFVKAPATGTYVIKNGVLSVGYDKDDIDNALANLQPFEVLTDTEIEDATEVIPPTTGLVNPIVDLIYPIGSIYISVSSTNPSTLFGGTWEALNSGAVIKLPVSDNDFAVYAGTNGRALSSKELNGLKFVRSNGETPSGIHNTFLENGTMLFDSANYSYSDNNAMFPSNLYANENSRAHLSVYMWKRTA